MKTLGFLDFWIIFHAHKPYLNLTKLSNSHNFFEFTLAHPKLSYVFREVAEGKTCGSLGKFKKFYKVQGRYAPGMPADPVRFWSHFVHAQTCPPKRFVCCNRPL